MYKNQIKSTSCTTTWKYFRNSRVTLSWNLFPFFYLPSMSLYFFSEFWLKKQI